MLKVLLDYIPVPTIIFAIVIFLLLPFDKDKAVEDRVTGFYTALDVNKAVRI